ncbi:MAG TPA: hypothetical protein VGM91_23340 [Conexibacter sp.]|jgi:hypothetical protein
MESTEELVIRSYRTVFSFERRLYRVDRWRIPLPGGVPLRALLYAPAVYALLALAGRLPLVGAGLGLLPPPLHWALLPLGLVVAGVRVQLDGRPAHRALVALARWRLAPRWLAGLRPCPPPSGLVAIAGVTVVRPDWRAPDYRGGRVRGPARVLLRRPAELAWTRSRRRLRLAPRPGAPLRTGRVLDVPAGAELELT